MALRVNRQPVRSIAVRALKLVQHRVLPLAVRARGQPEDHSALALRVAAGSGRPIQNARLRVKDYWGVGGSSILPEWGKS